MIKLLSVIPQFLKHYAKLIFSKQRVIDYPLPGGGHFSIKAFSEAVPVVDRSKCLSFEVELSEAIVSKLKHRYDYRRLS